MTGAGTGQPVQIVMIEDDEGHARLIERNIRRAGINNEIVPFASGTEALAYLLGSDGSARHPALLRPRRQRLYREARDYESFANAIRQLGLFLSVIQVP